LCMFNSVMNLFKENKMVDLDTKKVEDPEYNPEGYKPTTGMCVVLSGIAVITIVLIIVFWSMFISH